MPTDTLHASTVIVPHAELEHFDKQLAKLNEKALKFGLAPVWAGERIPVSYWLELREDTRNGDFIENLYHRLNAGEVPPRYSKGVFRAYSIDLTYPVIKLGNWRVIAQVEHMGESNLVFAVTDDPADRQIAQAYHQHPVRCDHCKTKRQRRLAYLLKDAETSEVLQVGSSCLQDFTGVDPAAVLFLAQLYKVVSVVDYSDGFEDSSYRGRASAYATANYLARVIYLIKKFGFISASKAREDMCQATYEAAGADFDFLLNEKKAVRDEFYSAYESLIAEAQNVIGWYRQIEPSNSFEKNVRTILQSDDILVTRSIHLAFAAAAVPGYYRHLQKQRDSQHPSNHVGEIGVKAQMALSVEAIFRYETQFGIQSRVNLRDEQGNRLTWKTRNVPDELESIERRGEPFMATFKVKSHDHYEETQVTTITHCRFLCWIND